MSNNIVDRRKIKKGNLFRDFFGEEVIPFFSGSLATLFDKPSEILKIPFRLAQAGLNGSFFNEFIEVYEDLREQGVFKDRFSRVDQTNLVELLKYFDEEVVDEEKFKALKSIFFRSIEKDSSTQDERDAYEFIQICKQLSGGEIMTLKIFYEFKTNPALIPVYNQSTSYLLDNWCQAAAERLGHKIPELIKNHYTKLAGLNILNPGLIKYSAPFSINSVVTNLGYRLGEFITKY